MKPVCPQILAKSTPSRVVIGGRGLRRNSAGFTLIEGLISGAILLVTVMGFYSLFLRVNDYAASSRCSSTGCVLLEQAANLALTTDWKSDMVSIPLVLQSTEGKGVDGWVTFDLAGQPGNAQGIVRLFTDPNDVAGSGTNVTGVLERKVTYSNDPGGPAKTLLQVGFRITYTFHSRTPVVLTSFTMRTRDD